jgi:RNA polymerase sigma-70 factor (ECF subfamily)
MRQTVEQVIAEHGAAIARVAAAFEADRVRRDDLMQEILVAIWQALPRFRGEASLKTFVLRIAHYRAVDHVLREKNKPARDEIDEQHPDDRPTPERRASLEQQAERLLAAVRQLPLEQRQLVTLALEGLPHQEIAGVLGISVNNVAVRLSRARSALQAQLGEDA